MTALSESLPELSYAATVAKELVHRHAISEVYLTDCRSRGHDSFAVGVHLPRAHRYYNDLTVDQHDVMILFEACRQAGILIAHSHYGVPIDWAFIFRFGDAPISAGALRAVPTTEQNARISVTMTRIYTHEGAVTGAKMTFDVYVGSQFLGVYDGSMSFLPKAMYRAIRESAREHLNFEGAPQPTGRVDELPAISVGRTDQANVVIGQDEKQQLWLVDKPEHPALCDHEVDHVSGMVIFEAARQAAIFIAPNATSNPSRFRIKFIAFAEKDIPVSIQVTSVDGGYAVDLIQIDATVASGYLEFADVD